MLKDTENVNSKVLKAKNGRAMLSSKCVVCGRKKKYLLKKKKQKDY